MFVVKNLRKEKKDGWTYLVVDFEARGVKSPFEEKTMWFAVEDKNADMLTDDVYDAFVLVPLYLGMHYHQDVHIEGKISPLLYHNITHYLMNIFDDFSDYTVPVEFSVDGFKVAKKGPVDLIGTGISCGVDSLTTIYDNYVNETDKNLRINSLLLTNCGTHGDYEDKRTREIWLKRAKMNQRTADELGLPTYLIDSNLHAFTHKIGEQRIGYLAIYSCVICLEKYMRRYYCSSTLSYDFIKRFYKQARDIDIAEYAESYMLPLIRTERIELVSDGCQYTREEKTERISDWDLAQKYLNVCVNPGESVENCSHCHKCMRTLLALEAMGKLDKFNKVFDLQEYHKSKDFYKRKFVYEYNKNAFSTTIIDYMRYNGMRAPSKAVSYPAGFVNRVIEKIHRVGFESKVRKINN